MSFERARAVADAVLFEGYALYPYRPDATKNRLRWQFGVLAPEAASRATGCDPWWMEAQCLVAGEGARVVGRLRFLRLRRRRVEAPDGAPIASLEVGGRLLVPWDEGEVCEIDFDGSRAIALDGDETVEEVRDGGAVVARVRRTREPLALAVTVAVEQGVAAGAARPTRIDRLRVRVANRSACAAPRAPRDETLGRAALGAHLLLAVEGGAFVSLLDPPPEAAAAAAACRNVGVWPVLAGEPGRADLVLASPIILYDHPAVAPESPGNLFDATEIDEILSLRTLLLTDEEKRLARAADPRVAALIDRVDALAPEAWGALHGAFRDPRVGGRVRLRPGPRRTDAQDMFLAGRTATVREVKRDVDGRECFAVTVDDDPAAELHLAHGRYHYFYADEVEPAG